MSELPTLVIGDVHGHLDRLEALLIEAAGKDEKDLRKEAFIIQLGDLGHFGGSSGSPTGDLLCWEAARDGWVDLVLWGNHDRAVIDPHHVFGGYEPPLEGVADIMLEMVAEGSLRLAAAAHGHLITHAGLHSAWKHQKLPDDVNRAHPESVAEYINEAEVTDPGNAIWDAISHHRGGSAQAGGILWRDFDESLYREFPQVFGHSASSERKVRQDGDSWCIDIGGKGARYNPVTGAEDPDPTGNCLAAIWLPSKEIVRVDL